MVSQPELLDDERYPEDVKERARTILDGCRGGSVGNLTQNILIIIYIYKLNTIICTIMFYKLLIIYHLLSEYQVNLIIT